VDDDVIFVKRGDHLVEMAVGPYPYKAEKVLQDLLKKHPKLLAGYQMDRGDPRRFVLVGCEVPVPDHPGGAGHWKLDLLGPPPRQRALQAARRGRWGGDGPCLRREGRPYSRRRQGSRRPLCPSVRQ
jgi:hypothetical protein